jgi:hypothetical protein
MGTEKDENSTDSFIHSRDRKANNAEIPMGSVIPFLKDQFVFEPDTTQAMAVAFDEVCRALKLAESATSERESVAAKIIDLARRGERNSLKLVEGVLGNVGVRAISVPPTLTA